MLFGVFSVFLHKLNISELLSKIVIDQDQIFGWLFSIKWNKLPLGFLHLFIWTSELLDCMCDFFSPCTSHIQNNQQLQWMWRVMQPVQTQHRFFSFSPLILIDPLILIHSSVSIKKGNQCLHYPMLNSISLKKRL